LEAKDRIGGRAYTDATGFDHGASWLHQANDNPLTAFAEALGFETVDHDKLRHRCWCLAKRRRRGATHFALMPPPIRHCLRRWQGFSWTSQHLQA
ncbi:MAG: FAD-dependent oxidoreductase, partial [bacterium]